ncbi:hypothetical protein QYM36_011033 [Artemia franciscana]|uniref:U1-type domain-containing protein n=1 Tax=Artemia franciscana TaxID=6661 RepID=A0AA88HMG5_ARTSF|nr:hypothetical protein QYM36_011033 [Artemia franciscana]
MKMPNTYSYTHDTPSTPPRKKDHKRVYNPKWEQEPDFKGWLQPLSGNNTKACCKICNGAVLRAHKSDLHQHYNSAKHKKNSQAMRIQEPVISHGKLEMC